MDNINQSKTNDISEPINLNETTAVPVANIDKEKIVDKIELDGVDVILNRKLLEE